MSEKAVSKNWYLVFLRTHSLLNQTLPKAATLLRLLSSLPPSFRILLSMQISSPFLSLSPLKGRDFSRQRRIRTISFKPPPPLTECTKFVLKLNNRKCIWMGKLRFSSKFHYKRFQRFLVLTHPIVIPHNGECNHLRKLVRSLPVSRLVLCLKDVDASFLERDIGFGCGTSRSGKSQKVVKYA